MENKRYKCDISIQNHAVTRTPEDIGVIKNTLNNHEKRISNLEPQREDPPPYELDY